MDTVRNSLNEHAIAHRSVHFLSDQNTKGQAPPSVLCQALFQEARAAKIAQLEVFVDTENYRAIRFYEKYGFEWVATHPDGIRMGANCAMTIFTAFDWAHSCTAVLRPDATAL